MDVKKIRRNFFVGIFSSEFFRRIFFVGIFSSEFVRRNFFVGIFSSDFFRPKFFVEIFSSEFFSSEMFSSEFFRQNFFVRIFPPGSRKKQNKKKFFSFFRDPRSRGTYPRVRVLCNVTLGGLLHFQTFSHSFGST